MQSTHDKALAYLKRYAKQWRGKSFSPEWVINAADFDGIAFATNGNVAKYSKKLRCMDTSAHRQNCLPELYRMDRSVLGGLLAERKNDERF